ncbi:MAG: hypothetical protein KIS76_02565 [Pyrinomonadaceae bacterium]|nr:hypothetical protein [Pyrinomonadaceae bacterium]
MDIFKQAKTELKSAERAISMMKTAKTFDEFEEAWKMYLNSIEKCWIKVERICQHKRNIFEPWQGKYKRLRKKDMLLRYLHHARNADQHTIEETVKHIPSRWEAKFPNGSGYIRSMKIVNGAITEYEGSPMLIESFPSRIELLRFKERGDWHNPPTQHLDKNLEHRDPISIAQKGFRFYGEFLVNAEDRFS